MRERCWFIPEQVLKGKLPYRDFETFYRPAESVPARCGLLYRRHRPHPGTGDRIRLLAHLSRRHVLSCPALELHRRFRVHAFCRALSGESGCRGLCVDGAAGLRPVLNLSLGAG
jgi:hypothetical protein